MSDEWCEEHDGSHCSVLLRLEARLAALEANQQGRDNERDTLLPILQDLIAELVGDDGDGHEMTPDGEACAVCVAIDRAEARLREVQGE